MTDYFLEMPKHGAFDATNVLRAMSCLRDVSYSISFFLTPEPNTL